MQISAKRRLILNRAYKELSCQDVNYLADFHKATAAQIPHKSMQFLYPPPLTIPSPLFNMLNNYILYL